MDIERDKYDDTGNGIRKDLFGELGDLFSDDKIHSSLYRSTWRSRSYRDPWIYDSDIRILYSMTIYQKMLY